MLEAKVKRPPTHFTLKRLIADEWRVSRRAFEALMRLECPREEIAFVDERAWSPSDRVMRRNWVLLDPNAIPVEGEELAVPA